MTSTSPSISQPQTQARTHSAADQINTIAGNAATHDLKGNLTEYEIYGKEYEVTYDLDNRIITADVDGDDVEYRYDAFGRRVIRQEGSTKSALIWWGNSEKYRRLVGILDKSVTTCPEEVSSREAAANQCAEHKHQAGQTVIQNDIMEHPSRLNSVIARAVDGSKLKLQWYHKNYLDHVYAVSDDGGDILEHYRYTAYGEVSIYDENGNLENYTQIDNHILWNTRRRDEVTGYYMYKFRHYSAELGRWPSRDPIEEAGGVNLYAFVGNRPIKKFDRLGLEWTCASAKAELQKQIKEWEAEGYQFAANLMKHYLSNTGNDYTPSRADKLEITTHGKEKICAMLQACTNSRTGGGTNTKSDVDIKHDGGGSNIRWWYVGSNKNMLNAYGGADIFIKGEIIYSQAVYTGSIIERKWTADLTVTIGDEYEWVKSGTGGSVKQWLSEWVGAYEAAVYLEANCGQKTFSHEATLKMKCSGCCTDIVF